MLTLMISGNKADLIGEWTFIEGDFYFTLDGMNILVDMAEDGFPFRFRN